MNNITQEKIDEVAKEIKSMNQYTLCYNWRFAKSGDIRFRNDLITSDGISLGELYIKCLKDAGGFTSDISKSIGW